MKILIASLIMVLAAVTASAEPETILDCNSQMHPDRTLELHITQATLTLITSGIEGTPLLFSLVAKQADETVYNVSTLGIVRIENKVFTDSHGELYTIDDSYSCM